MAQLTERELYSIMCELFPEQNDFGENDYHEELQELFDFGIETSEQLVAIISEHIEETLMIDAADMDEFEIKYFINDFGEEYVRHRIENKYWYAYAGLLRIILELEFEDDYREYAAQRDGIDNDSESEDD